MQTILTLLGFTAATLVLWGIMYRAPRLVGFEVDFLSATFAALFVSLLLGFEWVLFPKTRNSPNRYWHATVTHNEVRGTSD
jgi:hypothetical protein